MITHVPALDLLHQLLGVYTSEGAAELRLERVGQYGAVMTLRLAEQLVLAGVIGVQRDKLECLAQAGGPNLDKLVGELEGQALVFTGTVLDPFRLVFALDNGQASVRASLGRMRYALVRAGDLNSASQYPA